MCCSHSNPHKHLKPGAQGGLLGREGGLRGGIALGLCTGSPACFWLRLPGGLPIRWGPGGTPLPLPCSHTSPVPSQPMGGHAHSCSVTHQDRSLWGQPPLHHHGGPFPELGLGSASPRPRGHAGGGAPGKMAGLWQRGGSWLGGSSQHAQQTLYPFPEPQPWDGGRGWSRQRAAGRL